LFGSDDQPVSPNRFEPTHYKPGSPGKVMVMAKRAKAGLPLFHPRDGIFSDDNERQILLYEMSQKLESESKGE